MQTVTSQRVVRHASSSGTAVFIGHNCTLATSAVAEWFDLAWLQKFVRFF